MTWKGSFALASSPTLVFGSGELAALPGLVQYWGKKVLLITGGKSLLGSTRWPNLLEQLESAGIKWRQYTVAGEPSPMVVDRAVEQYREEGIEVVVGIGGGSSSRAAFSKRRRSCSRTSRYSPSPCIDIDLKSSTFMRLYRHLASRNYHCVVFYYKYVTTLW